MPKTLSKVRFRLFRLLWTIHTYHRLSKMEFPHHLNRQVRLVTRRPRKLAMLYLLVARAPKLSRRAMLVATPLNLLPRRPLRLALSLPMPTVHPRRLTSQAVASVQQNWPWKGIFFVILFSSC
jgi:hypothetical protein